MLYKEKLEPVLRDDLFANPPSNYRGTPFWAWNCDLKTETLVEQIEMMKKMGLGGFHMHVRTGMSSSYLTDEFMGHIRTCVEKAREEKMLAWLYDEDRWPSGAAGGIVTKDLQYAARSLLFTPTPYAADGFQAGSVPLDASESERVRQENGVFLAAYDVLLNDDGTLRAYRRIAESDSAEGVKWYAYREISPPSPWFNNERYLCTLDPKATDRFLEVTHERYKEVVGKDFGGLIPAIFTDEPQFPPKQTLDFPTERKDVFMPWVDDLPETYRAAYGADLLDTLPELFWELPDGKVSQARYRFHDFVTELFAGNFCDRVGNWCSQNGLYLGGHLMEEPTLRSQTHMVGEAMRSYRAFKDMPGIDMLCDFHEYNTAKQAQSAKHQQGGEAMLSELYGVTGWDFDFRGHKFQGDWQAALGVTLRVPHLAWVSMKGEAKRDYPAAIGYQSAWWQDYSVVEDHFARVATAMTRGKPVVRVGVIHPIESFWLHWGPEDQTAQLRDQQEERFQSVIRWMLGGSIDFDFICEANLPSQCPKGGAPLQVGQMAYDAIVVPGCETLRSTTLERLEAFREAGGKLIFLGEAPKYADAIPTDRGAKLFDRALQAPFTRNGVLTALTDMRTLEIRNSAGKMTENLVHQLRKDGDNYWLFIAHCVMPERWDLTVPQEVRITLDGCYRVCKYDTLTGKTEPMAVTVEKGKTVIETVLYESDSLLLRYQPGAAEVQTAEQGKAMATILPTPKQVAYQLSEPNVYLLDKAEYALDDEPYQPEEELLRADEKLRLCLGWHKRNGTLAQPWVIPDEPVTHKVRLRFTVCCAQSFDNIYLALEDADIAEIRLNGKPVTAKPDGWYVDKSIGKVLLGTLSQGDNVIELTLPFGKRTNVEWCYLLGDFGVRVCGTYRELIPLQPFLGFDQIMHQGLAHYGGNVTYQIPVTTKGGSLRITTPHYAGAALKVKLDGEEKGNIIYSPYQMTLENVAAGAHILELTLLGHRANSFGPVHQADTANKGSAPASWRRSGAEWTESYRLKPLGILTPPILEELKS